MNHPYKYTPAPERPDELTWAEQYKVGRRVDQFKPVRVRCGNSVKIVHDFGKQQLRPVK